MAAERRERLLNLVTMLLNSDGHTLTEIIETVPGFSDVRENARQEFVRDRRQLGLNGFPVETVDRGDRTEADQSDRWAYRISPERSVLPEFGLTDVEAGAIRQALSLVDLTGEADTFALWKLGGSDPLADLPVGDLSAPSEVGDLLRAASLGCEVEFVYNARPHRVRPFGLLMRRTNWYVSGELIGDGVRTYRIDRMSGVTVGEPGAFERPQEWDPEQVMPSESWAIPQGEPVMVDVAVRGPLAVWVESTLRSGSVIAEVTGDGPDGDNGVIVRLAVSFPEALRTWVLGFGDDAWVVGPPEMVEFVTDWLKAMRSTEASSLESARRSRPRASVAPQARAASGPQKTQPAMRWLRRTMAMLTWLSRQDGRAVAVSELASRFGVPASTVMEDLQLASVCGVPPYNTEDLFEIVFDDGDDVDGVLDDPSADPSTVEVSMSPVPVLQPAGPGELTSAEVLAVCTAGQVLLEVTEPKRRDALASALDKVRRSLDAAQFLRVALDTPAHVPVLRAAVRDRRLVRIDYFAATSNRISEGRWIEPLDVVLDAGRWYLDGWDRSSETVRRFRIDRVLDVEPSGETFERSAPRKRAPWPPEGSEVVVLTAPARAAWVGEVHPATLSSSGADRCRIELPVADERWLERLLLQIGPGVVVESPERFVGLPAAAAARVLLRYDVGSDSIE
ncbi:MAG: helix-turn-helix transcriptional regulator [Acidimicrobiia bacterium]